MCLVAFAIDSHRRFPFVVAANRDEFRDRAAARLGWWSPQAGAPEILAGRDLHAGGTWLGLSAAGRFALLTNIRDPARQDPAAPSRGAIVPGWLRGDAPMDRFWMRTALAGHNGFNLVAADFARGEAFWAANDGSLPRRLERGLWGLSNASLDTPWPKVTRLKARLRDALSANGDAEVLAGRLFTALADAEPAPDAELPTTGVSREWERLLSPAFIRSADGRYGTRASTVVVTERIGRRHLTHVFERSHDGGAAAAAMRRVTLPDWPPARSAGPPAPAHAA